MSFNDQVKALSQRVPNLKDHLRTEEATKNALVMPFIKALGYDVFNPQEVIPEFTADIGIKKAEKVDYAIMQEGEMIMLIECKKVKTDLSQADISQLYRYFTATKARIAILTNGVQYRLFTDLDAPNKMDSRPFLELDLENLRDSALAEVRRLTKEKFDLDRMLSAASELKYASEIKAILNGQFDNPEEDFVRFFFCQANPGSRFTAAVKAQFTDLVQKACQQFISERVSDRLRSALEEVQPEQPEEGELIEDDGIVTTEEEIEGYHIVRAIVSGVVDPERVVYRDTRSYMGILLDNNNRKPICRLRFNNPQKKYIGWFNEQKQEQQEPIQKLTEIYKYAEKFMATVLQYDGS
jgi:hypothetical protein